MPSTLTCRDFLRNLSLAPLAVGWPGWMPRLAFAPPKTDARGDVLVVVFLRGAADALNIVVPHGEDTYYNFRPTLAVPRPDDTGAGAANRVVDLDGFFGLHPSLSPLQEAWQAQHLAIIHACGAPDESRSHFKCAKCTKESLRCIHGVTNTFIPILRK